MKKVLNSIKKYLDKIKQKRIDKKQIENFRKKSPQKDDGTSLFDLRFLR